MSEDIKLSQLAHEISKLTTGPTPGYRALYVMALSAKIPAQLGPNGRWTVKREDLPRVVALVEAGPVGRALLTQAA
jgi:hypothetical protein